MTSSSKKKKEKKQDFAKPKLKVGKAKAKPSNFTSTSFKSKALVLATQSLNQTAPTQLHQLQHHLSLLTHHAATTRRESLAYLTTHLPPTFSPTADPQSAIPTSILIPALSPLILDSSNTVRAQLMGLLQTLPATQVQLYVPKIMLYINSAMTHISPEIRGDSTKFLAWLLSIDSDSLLRNGGWAKGLWGLIGVLGWGAAKDRSIIFGGGGEGTGSGAPAGGAKGKMIIQHLGVLQDFLRAGLHQPARGRPGPDGDNQIEESWNTETPHWTTHLHMVPSRSNQSNAYSYLGLFSVATSHGDASGNVVGEVEDLEARRRWLLEGAGKDALECLKKGLRSAEQEGGEIGRLGARVLGVLEDGLSVGVEDG